MNKAEIMKNLITPCETKEHLDFWLRYYLDVRLAPQIVSRFANTCPLDAAWLVYSHAKDEKVEDPLNALFVASRASQKTLMLAAVTVAVMIHFKRDILGFAASKEQAATGWKYIQKFLMRPHVQDLLDGELTKNTAKLQVPDIDNPANTTLVEAQVLAVTPMNVQSKHVSFLYVDELLTLKHDKKRAYAEIDGIPVASNDGKPYIRTEISSRKGAYTVVEDRISRAAKLGLTVKKWTAFELTKQCPVEIRGKQPLIFYGDPFRNVSVTPEEYEELPEQERDRFYKADAYENCVHCPIKNSCLGDAAKQRADLKELSTVKLTIANFRLSTLDLWISQRMSLQPTSEGVIYNKFSQDAHVKDAKEMLEIFTGKPLAYTPTSHQAIDFLLKNGCQAYVGIDHSGGSAEAAIVVVLKSPTGHYFITDEIAKEGMDLEEMIAHLVRLNKTYNFKCLYPDPAAADKNKIIRKRGFRVIDDTRKEILAGVEIVRSSLMTADNKTRLFLLKDRTLDLQSDFSQYHFLENSDATFKDVPAEERSHRLDALRYAMQNLAENGNVLVAGLSDEEKKAIDSQTPHIERVLQNSIRQQMRQAIIDAGGDPDTIPDEYSAVDPTDGVNGFKWII